MKLHLKYFKFLAVKMLGPTVSVLLLQVLGAFFLVEGMELGELVQLVFILLRGRSFPQKENSCERIVSLM